MRKKYLTGLIAGLFTISMAGIAQATLTTIGTATYASATNTANNTPQSGTENTYNLIWDDDNNGKSVIWLDYGNVAIDWWGQNVWAAGLDSFLTYEVNPAYIIDWVDDAWRLPSSVDGEYEWGYDNTTTAGYNITTSEMGHLFYEELGRLPERQSYPPIYGLQNTGDFQNLLTGQWDWYWSGTERGERLDYAWDFYITYGYQGDHPKRYYGSGLAIRSGEVSTAPIPEPTTILLFGTGIAGLVGSRLRRRKK